MQDGCLFCRLPSGRFLRYWQPRLEQGHWADGTPKQFLDLTVLFVKGRMVFRRTLWRGLAFQNVVSAIEVELLCTSLVNMDRRKFPVVLTCTTASPPRCARTTSTRRSAVPRGYAGHAAWTAGTAGSR